MASLRPSLLYVYRADHDFAICYLDDSTRFFKNRSTPPVRLDTPGSDEHEVSRDYNPDTDEAVLADASPNAHSAMKMHLPG